MIGEEIRNDAIARRVKGESVNVIAKELGISPGSVCKIVSHVQLSDDVASALKRRGCNTTNMKRKVESVEVKSRPVLSKTDLGEAARQMICAKLMFSGVKVFRPLTEDTPVDLLVLTEQGKVIKCQCKYVFPCRRGSHQIMLHTSRKNGPNSKAVLHRYAIGEVDVFLGYCQDNDAVYVIPNEDTGGRQNLNLWIVREPIGKCQSESFDSEKYKNNFHPLK
jgi:hypothetical protein